MIRVHSYCSYKLSPSGFQYGTFEITDDAAGDMYYLSDEKKDFIVSSAFDYGIVKRLKGKLPKKHTFIFLFKKISYTYDGKHDDVGGDVAMNMAFEFDDYKQFVSFSNGFENYEEKQPLELARLLADCIVPDISIKRYKLSIRKKNIDDWLSQMISSQQSIETDQPRLRVQLGIITDSNEKRLYCDELQEIFDFDTINGDGNEVGIMYLEGATYVYPVKKKEMSSLNQPLQQRAGGSLLLKILVVAFIVGLIVILMMMLSKNKHYENRETAPMLSIKNYSDAVIYDVWELSALGMESA